MIGSDTLVPVETGEATAKETPEESAGTGSVAPESSTEGQDQAGASKESAEGGSEEGRQERRRGPTKLDTIRELRSKLRERDQRYGSEMESLRSQIEEMKSMIAASQRGQKPGRTFWEAPEDVLDERLQGMEKRLLERFQERESMNQETAEWKQETSEAAKLIKNQNGLTPEDEADITEIVESTPEMQNLRPMQRARYALYLWKESKGIHQDKSGLKAKAATVVGAPPVPGGPRLWTESEIEAELNKFPKDPKVWTPEQSKAFDALDRELREAVRDNRMRK